LDGVVEVLLGVVELFGELDCEDGPLPPSSPARVFLRSFEGLVLLAEAAGLLPPLLAAPLLVVLDLFAPAVAFAEHFLPLGDGPR
jgi:hypothetical protein